MSGGAPAEETALDDVPRLLATLPRRISDIATLRAARAPDDPALRERGRSIGYGELAAASAAAADDLAAIGVRAGDRVLIVGENCAALPALLFAVARLDAWSVVVNARLSARELDAIRDHCTPRLADLHGGGVDRRRGARRAPPRCASSGRSRDWARCSAAPPIRRAAGARERGPRAAGRRRSSTRRGPPANRRA